MAAAVPDAGAPGPERGLFAIGSYVVAVALLSVMDASAKWLTTADYPVGQVTWFRCLFALVPLAFVLGREGLPALATRRPGMHLVRGVCMAATIMTFFLGLKYLPLADVTAVFAAGPLFMTALAAAMLRERVPRRHVIAVLAGFLGVSLILQPSLAALRAVALLPLAAAVGYALAMIATRSLARTETSVAVVFWGNLVVLVLSGLTALSGWVVPALPDLGVFALMGVAGGTSHFFFIHAFRFASVSTLSPFDYTSILWAVLFGYALWGEVPGPLMWTGAAMIVLAGTWTLRRPALPDPAGAPSLAVQSRARRLRRTS